MGGISFAVFLLQKYLYGETDPDSWRIPLSAHFFSLAIAVLVHADLLSTVLPTSLERAVLVALLECLMILAIILVTGAAIAGWFTATGSIEWIEFVPRIAST